MTRAIPVSIVLHLALFIGLSLWLASSVNDPAASSAATLRVRLNHGDASNQAELSRDNETALQARAAETTTAVPVAPRQPSRRPTDAQPPPAVAVTGAAEPPTIAATEPAAAAGMDPRRIQVPPDANNEPPPAANAAALVLASDAPAVRQTPVDSAPAAQQTRPFSNKQHKMLARKVKRWSAELSELRQEASVLSWTQGEQRYNASFRTIADAGEMGIERVMVEVSTLADGTRLSTRLNMRRLAFSNFAQFVDRWDPSVQIHDDELDGRFHSNSEISVLSDRTVMPRFKGKVTTASRRVDTSRSRGWVKRDAIFLGGLETGVRRITLPKKSLPFPQSTAANEINRHLFQRDARITFHSDGSYDWQYLPGGPLERRPMGDEPLYLLGGKKVKLHVQGTVKGKVLVHSPERIIIEGPLVYADYPDVAPDSGNYIGLVSDRTVEIAEPDVTGPGDLQITAAIYARRRFTVRRYRARENATLTIFGSLTSGSLSATEPRYATRIRFDPRLAELRPPRFPMSDRYEVESWDQRWTAAAEQ